MGKAISTRWQISGVGTALRSRVRSRLALTWLGYIGLPTIETLRGAANDAGPFSSQLGQDLLVSLLLSPRQEPGTFVDIGAHDGISLSNTYFLEKYSGWKGLCVEANPKVYKTLADARSCITENCAIGAERSTSEFWQIEGYAEMLSGLRNSYDPRHQDRIMKEIRHRGGKVNRVPIEVVPLQDLLDRHEMHNIDFLSIDTEGSELDVLRSVNFGKTRIRMMSVENKYFKTNINRFLCSQGFLRLLRLGSDEIYIHKEFFFKRV